MSIKRVAIRYAEALIELANEQGKLDVVKEDIDLLRALTQNREFFSMLKSPIIPHPKKKQVVNELLGGKLDDLTMKFLLLLIDKERSEVLPEIALEFIGLYRAINHISKVKIYSAEQIEKNTVNHITEKLQKANVVMENVEVEQVIDTELIGGFVLEFGDFIYDASVKNQLAEMKRDFSENLYKSKIVKR